MKKKQSCMCILPVIILFIITTVSLYASGSGENANPVPLQRSKDSFTVTGHPEKTGHYLIFNGEDYSVELNLSDLSCLLIDRESRVNSIVSKAAFAASRYQINAGLTEVSYPEHDIKVKIGFKEKSFSLEFSSRKPRKITWPSVVLKKEGTALIWPHFEGNYIPLSDKPWTDYLKSRQWNTTESQYLPFWGVERGRQLLSYLFENPFHNEVVFKERKGALQMDFTHTFPDNSDLSLPIKFRVYLDYAASPIMPARYFRQYLKEQKAFVSLQDKRQTAPGISRLIGAAHAYIWDGKPITKADIKPDAWIPMAQTIITQAASGESSAGGQIMHALSPEKGNFGMLARQSAPHVYLQDGMVYALSRVLRSSSLYSESVWPLVTLPVQYRSIAGKILAGDMVPDYELVPFNSFLLYTSFPMYLSDPATWGNGVSTRMIDALVENGMNRFVLTCNGIENIGYRPHIASYAAEKGYLIGPYDGYESIQDPDAPEWSTAIFDRSLYETGGIIRADGTPVKGFLDVGYTANPLAVKPYFEKRMAENFQTAPHSYYFLDGDAFGQFYDDYKPGRITSESGYAAATVDRIRTVFEKYRVPIGSEGGSYLCAGSLAQAEGVFFPVITGDPDMDLNEMSRYFVGRYMPDDEPERHFLPVPLKEKYVHLYSDPRFRLPLYEAVFHDSVITSSHYSSASLKFTNIAETTALTEILYQAAPMYHFNLSYFEKIKAKIKKHIEVFEKTHTVSWRYALEEFNYLTADRTVQRTKFGNLVLTANFREKDFDPEGTVIPARSVLIKFTDTGESFIYRETAFANDIEYTQDISFLIKTLSSEEGQEREQAALAVSRMGVEAKAAVPHLIRALNDKEWPVRGAAAKALANMEGEAVPAVPALMKALQDDEWQVRRPAAYALAALGKAAKAAVPLLIKALDDEEWQVRKPAALALGAIGARKAVSVLKEKINDPELQVRRAAALALENIDRS